MVIFTAALPRGSWDYSIYTKVASQALDCPFESISLPLLSCWCLRRQTARLHRASLRLSTTRAEGGDPLYRSLPSPSVPENDREEENLKAHEVKKKKIVGETVAQILIYRLLGKPAVLRVFAWDCGMVKTELNIEL